VKTKMARRWLNRHKWKIAQFNRGHFKKNGQFSKNLSKNRAILAKELNEPAK